MPCRGTLMRRIRTAMVCSTRRRASACGAGREGARRSGQRLCWLARLGTAVIEGWQGTWDMLGFLGKAVIALGRFVVGKARFRRLDLALFLQECGAQALGIVTLISFLVGLILVFMGAMQLREFGAQMYVDD